jgi:hypothetical protein
MSDYEAMKAELLTWKKPSIGQLVETVLEFSIAIQVCAAIGKVHPGDYHRRLSSLTGAALGNPASRGQEGEYSLSVTVTKAINEHLFPIDEIWLWDEMMNVGEDPVVHLSIQGPRLSYDDFADAMSTNPYELPEELSFPIMVALLWGWFEGDAEIETVWKVYNERFHWGVPDWPDFPDDRYLDFKLFRRQLKKRGIGPLYTALLAIDGDTGNIFFDFNYEYHYLPTIDTQTLVELHKAWEKAQPLIGDCSKAFELLFEKPDTYIAFLEAYQASLRRREEKKNGSTSQPA